MPRKTYGETTFGERLQSIHKARGLTQVQLAEVAGTTQRAISYYETEARLPPAPAVIAVGRALKVSTDEPLGVALPERDQKAVIRLINSLVAVCPLRRNDAQGERNGQ
ncbi:MAG TPA: helix-turn-helix transcriptional regulator [Bryobacteraceae bacterium]|nr:helix-turn-helix transcriptional regulator [Bryobacteraceae bacterium]